MARASATLLRWMRGGEASALADLVTALGHCGAPSVAHEIAPFGRHADAEVRVAVAQALGALRDVSTTTVEALVRLTNDPLDEVRSWAAFALADDLLEAQPGVADALAARLRDPCDEVRIEAVRGLARRGDARAVDAALDLAPDWCEDPTFRQAVSGMRSPEAGRP